MMWWWQGRELLKKKEEEEEMAACEWTKIARLRCRWTDSEQSDLRQPRKIAEGRCISVVAGRVLADPVHWNLCWPRAFRGKFGWRLCCTGRKGRNPESVSHLLATTGELVVKAMEVYIQIATGLSL